MRIARWIACLCLAAATPAAAAWQEASSKHFVVYSDDSPERVAAFTTKLEKFDKAVRVLRGLPDPAVSPEARVFVYVVPGVSAVGRLAGSSNVAGFYIPRASQSVAFVPRRSTDDDLNALTILLHEYTHHLMFSTWGGAVFPAWMVEGFAEFHATARFKPDGSVLLGAPPQYRAYGIFDYQRLPATKLLTSRADLSDPLQTQIFYGRAWLLTHYLSMDAERRKQLSAYIVALNKGVPAADAAKLLGDARQLDRQLNAYGGRSTTAVFALPADKLAIEPVRVRALSPGAAAVMPARIASVRGVDAKTAPGVAALARRAAAPYPNDPAAQNVLAEAEHDAGEWDASEAAAARALAADPRSIHALMYAGLARAGALRAAKSTDPAKWAAVRGWFSRANRLDPEYAWPLEMFYQASLESGRAPSDNAQDGLLYAHALAPFDADLGFMSAYVLLKRDRAGEAETVLKPIAYNPHGGAQAEAATAFLTAIRDKGAAGALALMDQRAAEAKAAAAQPPGRPAG